MTSLRKALHDFIGVCTWLCSLLTFIWQQRKSFHSDYLYHTKALPLFYYIFDINIFEKMISYLFNNEYTKSQCCLEVGTQYYSGQTFNLFQWLWYMELVFDICMNQLDKNLLFALTVMLVESRAKQEVHLMISDTLWLPTKHNLLRLSSSL